MRIATMCAECGNNAPAEYRVLWRGPVDQIYSPFKGVLKVIKEEEGKTIRFEDAIIAACYINPDTRKCLGNVTTMEDCARNSLVWEFRN